MGDAIVRACLCFVILLSADSFLFAQRSHSSGTRSVAAPGGVRAHERRTSVLDPPLCTDTNWTYQNSGVTTRLYSVSFADALTGWAAGVGGVIIHTTDGGLTWLPQTPNTSKDINSISFIDAQHGVAVGTMGLILTTTSGGATWTVQRSGTNADLNSVAYPSPDTMYAVGDDGKFIYSDDGGMTWTSHSTGVSSSLSSVAFRSSRVGAAVGPTNIGLRTTDGGHTWGQSSLAPWIRGLGLGVTFDGADTVIVVGNNFAIWRSNGDDGSLGFGGGFSPPPSGPATVCASSTGKLYFTGAMTVGWSGSARSNIQLESAALPQEIYGSSVVEGDRFTAVGDGGFILRSADPRWAQPQITLASPANGSSGIQLAFDSLGGEFVLSTTVGWHSSPPPGGGGPVTYEVQVSADSTFRCELLTTHTWTTDTSAVVNFLIGGETYYWRVHAYTDMWRGSWSNRWLFQTAVYGGMQAPAIVLPTGGAVNVTVDAAPPTAYAKFAWRSVQFDGSPTSAAFEVQVSTDSTFQGSLVDDTLFHPSYMWWSAGGDTADWVSGLTTATTYFWRVRAKGTETNSAWSAASKFSTSASLNVPPPITIDAPASGSTSVAHVVMGQNPSPGVLLQWERTPPRTNADGSVDTAQYQVVFGTDSADVSTEKPSLIWNTGSLSLLQAMPLFEKCYWRVQSVYVSMAPNGAPEQFSIGGSGWSAMRTVTSDLQPATVMQIQHVDSSNLAHLDVDQFGDPAQLQVSPLHDTGLTVVARCVVPPTYFTKGGPTMIVADSGDESGAWHSVMLQPLASSNPEYVDLGLNYQSMLSAFNNVHLGDLLLLRGFIAEVGTSTMTNTVFSCASLTDLGASNAPIGVAPVTISDFSSGGRISFSHGEPWEGSVVELHNMTVHSILDSTAGTFDMVDSLGNIMTMTDQSCWFTMASHRNAASTYAIPQPGTHIASMRGAIVTVNSTYAIAPIAPGDIDFGTPSPHAIIGQVFWDDNGNGIRDSGEVTANGFPLVLSGTATYKLTTSVAGTFSMIGLDSGDYVVSYGRINSSWVRTTAQGSVQVNFGTSPETAYVAFGFQRSWNTVSGAVFDDLNENFVPDAGDLGVSGWKVIVHGVQIDSTITDSAGNFTLKHVDAGPDTLSTSPPAGWEQIFPQYYYQYVFFPVSVGGSYASADFAVHKIPARAKVFMNVHDNSSDRILPIAWGNRGGATYGIAGVDPSATNYDYSEGELELPSLEAAIQNGYFDVRFLDPRAESNRFGGGSWVDMRDFTAAAQVDTHKVSFYPGYVAGGNYPMTLTWDKNAVAAAYNGAVDLIDSLGNTTDMRLVDSLVVTDVRVHWLFIISHDPNVPINDRLSWKIASVPSQPLLTDLSEIFNLPVAGPFSFSEISGYSSASTLQPGVGYWLKFLTTLGALNDFAAFPTLPETLNVVQGWNLVGGPPVTVSAAGVSSPAPTVLGQMFGFDGGYVAADSVEPFSGYWVHASASGQLIYGAGAAKSSTTVSAAEVIHRAAPLVVSDADGASHKLYFYSPTKAGERLPDASQFALPPSPPQGLPDVRFSTGRCLEYVTAGTTEYTIQVGGAGVFPLTIAAPLKPLAAGVTIEVKVGNKYVSLVNNSTVTLTSPVKSFTLRVTAQGDAAIPREFALRQNYPNPFNPTTTVKYDVPFTSNVRLDVYDILGRLVTTLAQGEEAAGYKEATWNAANVGSGTYFYRMEATGISDPSKHFSKAMKMVVVR